MKKKVIFGVLALAVLSAVALAGCTPAITVNVPATPVTITTPAATTSPASLMGGTVEQMIQLQMYKSILGDTTTNNNDNGGWHGGHGHGHGH